MAEEARGIISVDLDNTKAVENSKKLAQEIGKSSKEIEKRLGQTEKSAEGVGSSLQKASKDAVSASNQIVAAQKQVAASSATAAKQVQQANEAAQVIGTKKTASGATQRDAPTAAATRIRSQNQILVQEAKNQTKVVEGEQRRQTRIVDSENKLRVESVRRARQEETAINRRAAKEAEFAAKQASPWYALGWQARTSKVPASQILQSQINQGWGRSQAMQQIQAGSAGGLSGSWVWQQQMNQAIARSNAQAAAQMFAPPPPPPPRAGAGGAGGAAGGGGIFNRRRNWRGGGWNRLIGGGAGGFAAGMLGGVGIGVGGYAVARMGGAVVEAAETATAYDRQRVAAEELAGSQQQLNDLLRAYGDASGGAIDKTTTLANVTRLLATGFADSAPEVERFVSATRGASIALGKPQDYVIQETQLAISNTSVKRLDQIGLGISEVQQRISELRDENKGWTREVAFSEAVLGIMEEKYGSLATSMEGQKTGLEQLKASWSDLMLIMGQGVSGPLNAASAAFSRLVNGMMAAREEAEKFRREGIAPENNSLSWEERAAVEAVRHASSQGRDLDAEFRDSEFEREVRGRERRHAVSSFLSGLTSFDITDPSSWFLGSTLPRPGMPTVSGGGAPAPRPEYGPTFERTPLWEFTEAQTDVLRDAYEADLEITRNYNRQRTEAVRQYEEQRTNLIRSYAKQNAREEEDFQRQRARSLRDYQRSIVQIMRDSQERESDLLRDYNERVADSVENYNERVADSEEDLAKTIAEIREEGEETLVEIQEKYNEEREKAEKAHRDTLLSAAAKLDAFAIWEERKRWERENEERKKGLEKSLEQAEENQNEQIEKAREAHQERVEDARKAHEKQLEQAKKNYERALEDGRKADEKRLTQMRADRALQLADEDEDRRIRKARAEEDHQDQLTELDRQHDATMERLKREAEDQREALVTALEDDLAALDLWLDGVQKRHDDQMKDIDDWFDDILMRIKKIAEEDARRMEAATGPISVGEGDIHSYEKGGYVGVTGPAMLHAGEFVLSRDMLASSSQYSSSSYSNRSVTIESGAFQVFPSQGMDEEAFSRRVYEVFEEALDNAAGA